MDDETIEVNNKNFSIRKILGEGGWVKYCKLSRKMKQIVRLQLHMDLYKVEVGFMRLQDQINNRKGVEL